MADLLTRREHVARVIQGTTGEINAAAIARLNAAAGFSPNRNTARKDLRAMVARGLIVPVPGPGNRTYTRTEVPS